MPDSPINPPPNPAAHVAGETRISTLVGDRLCISCGYNLVGQPILRESHYEMLIVRCPECATVASVQEYPLLGRWANRWAALLAAGSFLVLMVLWIGSASAIFGLSLGATHLAAEQFSESLYERFSQWQMQQTAASALGAVAGPSPRYSGTTTGFSTWWQQQDPSALLQAAGGFRACFGFYVWYVWMWLAIVAASLGMMWAVIMLARGRAGLLLWSGIIMLTAAALIAIPIMEWWSRPPSWTHMGALQQIGVRIAALTMLWAWFWLVFGLMVGRPVARMLVLLLLPPRMRSSMAFLWLTDGREPPRNQTLKN